MERRIMKIDSEVALKQHICTLNVLEEFLSLAHNAIPYDETTEKLFSLISDLTVSNEEFHKAILKALGK
jgi:hypothetical protein